MKKILPFLIAVTAFAQSPTPTPIETNDVDVYDTRKVTGVGTTVVCDDTVYIYSINVTTNSIGGGGRLTVRGRNTGNAIYTGNLAVGTYYASYCEGLPLFGGIELVSTGTKCDVDITIDYRRSGQSGRR